MKEIRLLRADEIEVRVAESKNFGIRLLLYKDARCDMAILDEVFGTFGWQRRHSRDNANCIVSIWDEDHGQWVDKEDTGTESNVEKAKGLASDSFKRACFNVGIGRELYTAPRMWFPIEKTSGSGTAQYDGYEITDLQYDGRNIKSVTIVDLKTLKVHQFTNNSTGLEKRGKTAEKSHRAAEPTSTPVASEDRVKLAKLLEEAEISREWLAKKYGAVSFQAMDESLIRNALAHFEEIKNIWKGEKK